MYNLLFGIEIKIKMLIELSFTASYKYIFMKKLFEKEKIIIKHKKSLVSTNKWSIKTIISLTQLIAILKISSLKLLEVADWEPYNKKLISSLTLKFKTFESVFSRFSKSSILWGE